MTAQEPPSAVIAKAQEAIIAAVKAKDNARERGAWSDVTRFDREMTTAICRLNGLRESARSAFAASRGWRHDKRKWARISETGRNSCLIAKRPEFYRDKEGRIVGMVAHTQATSEDVAAYAARNGYNAELLPFSWYEPTRHIAVLFMLKAGARWPNMLTLRGRDL